MTASPIRNPLAALLLAVGVLVLVAAGPARAAPTISGADTDVWNASRPEPIYTITASNQRLRIFWQAPGGRSGEGRSPLTVRFGDLADGTYRLQASEGRNNGGFNPVLARTRSFRVDITPPTITITRPSAGSSVLQGSTVMADYACAGAVSCAGPVASGVAIDTGTPGEKAFRVAAKDDAGNEATLDAGYTVAAPDDPLTSFPAAAPDDPSAPFPATTPTTAVVGVVSPRPVPLTGPATINARALHPRRGATIATRRPLLTWPRLARARLYNLQLFRLRNAKAVKVLSVFPRVARYRVPPRKISLGDRYVWRVWPFLADGYPTTPLGLSFFDVTTTLSSAASERRW